MNPTFQNWQESHPFLKNSLIYSDDKNCHWARIRANWKEKKIDGKTLSHLCAFTIDLHTGDLYLDCRKRKIWAKCFALTLGRPFFGLVKTMYHLFLPLSIPMEIFKSIFIGVQQKQSFYQISQLSLRNIKNSLADIIRTPVYMTAMTIVTLSAVIFGPFAPLKIYDLRALAGRLENALNRGEESIWNMAPCFQPLDNIMDIHQHNFEKADTEYEAEPALHGLNNLARSYVKFRRRNHNLFNDCGFLQPLNKPYTSAASAV